MRKVRRGGVCVDVDEELCDEEDEDDARGNGEARRVRAARCCAARGTEVEDKHDESTGVSALVCLVVSVSVCTCLSVCLYMSVCLSACSA